VLELNHWVLIVPAISSRLLMWPSA
jgi:hypothetical protein